MHASQPCLSSPCLCVSVATGSNHYEYRRNGIAAKLRCMKRGGRKAAEFFGDLLGCDSPRLGQRFPDQKFRENRTRCDGGDTALRLEAGGSDAPALDAHRQPQNVAAHGIRHVHAGRRIGQLTGVVRIAKMLYDGAAEHRREYSSVARITAPSASSPLVTAEGVNANRRSSLWYPARRGENPCAFQPRSRHSIEF
jgi:hypothetical protein